MSAAVHRGDSLRKAEEKRRVVYKAVLDTPFILKWPFTPAEKQNDILRTLCTCLAPLGKARSERRRQRKEKVKATEQLPRSPTVVTGINAITRSLERKDPDDSDALVFVCRNDIDPPQLCAHIPQLCALASRKLIQLPQGAEKSIADALGLKRVGAIQVKGTGDEWDKLVQLTSSTPTLTAPWLEPRYMATQIKTLETSAPIVKRPQQQQQKQKQKQNQKSEAQKGQQQNKNQQQQQQQQKQKRQAQDKWQNSNNKKPKQA